MTAPAKLPEKLSDLLELAVRDAQAVGKRKGYTLDMAVWHVPNGTCRVCLAGSVMVRHRLCSRRAEMYSYDQLKEEVEDRAAFVALRRIDGLRQGEWIRGAKDIPRSVEGAPLKARPALRLIADAFDYDLDGGRAPWDVYLKAAQMLREVGL